MNKHREFFFLSKYVLDEDVNRSIRIEEKASRQLVVLTLFFGVVCYICSMSMTSFIPTTRGIDIFGLSFCLIFVILFIYSWMFSFEVVRRHKLRRMPMNREMVRFFDNNELDTIYHALSQRFAEAYQENKARIDVKAGYLGKSYRAILYSFICVLFVLLTIGLKASRCF